MSNCSAVNDIFDTQDDEFCRIVWNITARNMVLLTRAPQQDYYGVQYRLASALFSMEGSTYRGCLDIHPNLDEVNIAAKTWRYP